MRLSFLPLAFNFFYVAYSIDVISRTGDLHVVNKQLSPDGFKRDTVIAGTTAASASFPGPLITGNKGDVFNLNVIDSLNDPSMNQTTSIHWHGIFQEHTNWADGPSFVTQCPIAPGHSFLYTFAVPDQAGTFWWHSHLGAQYCDGLRGPLVVYDPFDPQAHLYDIDDETTVLTLADWYHPTSLEILASPTPPTSNATLINGQGRYPGNTTAPLAVVNVQHGKRYRFRLISMSCDPAYTFSIDGHNLTIIEVDGVSTTPVTVNSIPVFAAQRYSFVLNANQPVGNYWIRALPSAPLANAGGDFTDGINSAILRYKGASNADPTTSQQTTVVSATESLLHPLQNPGAPGKPFPGGADKVINMTLGFSAGPPVEFTVNDVPFESPNVPVLLQILSGAQAAQNLLPAGSVYSLPKNKVIEINFFGGTAVGGPHPFHLHGHTFDVIKSAGNATYNFKNPVRRDTTAVAQGDQTTIRFTTDNSGPWFLHCHIDWHLAAGLAVVMAEDIPDVKLQNPVPPDWSQLCPIYNSLKPSQL